MKNKKIIIISSVLLIVVVALLLGILYFTTDLFKSNKDLFYEYVGKTKIIDSNFKQTYLSLSNKIKVSDYSSSMVIDFSQKQKNTTETNAENIFEIRSNGLKSSNKNQAYNDYTFVTNNQQLGTIKFLKDGNTYALGADNILAKYIGIENSNLRSFFAKLGVSQTEELPDEIPTVDIDKILEIDSNVLTNISKRYYNVLYNNIDNTHFSKIKNTDKTETITLSLNEQETVNVIQELLKTAKDDTELLNLITNKAQMLGYNNVNSTTIQNELQNYINNISNNIYTSETDFLVISLKKQDKNIQTISIQTKQRSETTDGIIEYKKYEITLDLSKTQTINITVKENEVQTLNLMLNYGYDANNIFTNITLNDSNNYVEMKLQINDYNTDKIIANLNLVFNSSEDEQEYLIDSVNNINIKEDIQIEKLTTENFAKLNDMTEEELNMLFTAIANRIIAVYGEQIQIPIQ